MEVRDIARNESELMALRGRRDKGIHSSDRVQFSAQGLLVERLVSNKGFKIDVRDQLLDSNTVAPLAWQRDKAGQIAQSINQNDDLRRQPTA
jgi:hypothetical protein